MLAHRLADALHDAAVQLALEQRVVDDAAAVVDRDIAQQLSTAPVSRVDLDLGDVRAAGKRARRAASSPLRVERAAVLLRDFVER